MRVLLVRLRPGIDRSTLNFLPVAVRERPESTAISARDFSFWHGAQYSPAAGARAKRSCQVRQPFRQALLVETAAVLAVLARVML